MSQNRHAPSMQRLILGYAPANLVPAAVAIGSIFVFTRLLSAPAFGEYSLAFSVMMVLQSVLFFGPTLAITRFYTRAADEAGTSAFLKTMYSLLLALGTLAVVAWIVAMMLLPAHGSAALIVPLLLLRSLVAANQTVNRAAGHMLRLNVIECLHAVLGLAAGGLLTVLGWRSGGAVMAGLVIAAATCAAIDIRHLANLRARVAIDRALLREMLRFVWPLMLAWIVLCSLQYADRFLVDTYGGATQLAVYVVAFSIVDRPITLICLSVTAGTFQLAVDTYLRDGAQAGRRQAGHNGAVLLGLALPACAGLMLTSNSVTQVLVGPALRHGVAGLVPIMAVTSLLRGVSVHYIDHAFHLANRSLRLFAVYLPSAAANIALSALLVPRYGMIAAAYGALGCQAAAVVAGWLAAKRVLPLWLPAQDMARIGLCLAAMVAVVLAVPLPISAAGLLGAAVLGVVTYAGAAIAVDLGGVRRMLLRREAAVLAQGPREVPSCPT